MVFVVGQYVKEHGKFLLSGDFIIKLRSALPARQANIYHGRIWGLSWADFWPVMKVCFAHSAPACWQTGE
jgi:hypothetical protein